MRAERRAKETMDGGRVRDGCSFEGNRSDMLLQLLNRCELVRYMGEALVQKTGGTLLFSVKNMALRLGTRNWLKTLEQNHDSLL